MLLGRLLRGLKAFRASGGEGLGVRTLGARASYLLTCFVAGAIWS